MSARPQEMSLLDRVKSYASSAKVRDTPWLSLLMDDVIVELERLRQLDAAMDDRTAGKTP